VAFHLVVAAIADPSLAELPRPLSPNLPPGRTGVADDLRH
jgi:hypothetical protein